MKIFYPLLFQHSLLNNFMQKPERHMNLFNFRIEIFRFVYEKPIRLISQAEESECIQVRMSIGLQDVHFI